MERKIMLSDIGVKMEDDKFIITGNLTAYFNYKLMKINADNCPKKYWNCDVHCNGKYYREVFEINHYDKSILIYKRDKKGEFIINKNGNLKIVKIYGKIKVFFK